MTLLAKRCNKEVDEACIELSGIPGKQIDVWRWACNSGMPEGCQMLMMQLADQCNQGRGESCYELRLFLTPLDAGQARG